MKKHPILTVLVILACLIVLFSVLITTLSGSMGSSSGIAFTNKVGVIPIIGAIEDSTEVLGQLKNFTEDKSIKAIILRIDSPGGGVGASQEIYREIGRTREEKPVVVSMGGVAASGGFYIAAACDKIVANPGTITGSIGVIMQYYKYRELAEKIGFKQEVIKSGEFKDIGNPHRDLTEKDREILDAVISDIQSQFVDAVAAGRNLPVEKVREIADGRIFTGETAKKWGLVDELGNFEDAIILTKDIAGIDGEVNLVYPQKKKLKLLDILLGEAAESLSNILKNSMKNNSIEYRWDGFSSGMN
ncbi:MAG: signal peptide peptidase SppA [Deltaproteobacteria bacterium]|nr:signal peptide peptidase SppA [Deltaproteobacteria bacterium]